MTPGQRATIADLASLDWDAAYEFPEDFEILDAILLVKGVYRTDDGDFTRPTWANRWTMALAKNVAERIGALEMSHRLAMDEALEDYAAEDE